MKINLRSNRAGLIIFRVLIGFLLICTFCSVRGLYQARSTRTWLRAPGTILSSQLIEQKSGENIKYKAVATYKYFVQREHYQSNAIRFNLASSTQLHDHQSIVAKIPTGKNVYVFYNPDNPAEAVLVRGISLKNLIGFLLCIMLTTLFTGGYLLVKNFHGPDEALLNSIQVIRTP